MSFEISEADITRARHAARKSDDITEQLVEQSFDGVKFIGSGSDLRDIRQAMKHYEEHHACFGEDKLMAESRFNLQFA